jgi:hypothetical protein
MPAASPVPRLRESPPVARSQLLGLGFLGGAQSVGNFNALPSANPHGAASLSGWRNLPSSFPADARGLLQALATVLTSGSFGGGSYVAGPPLQSSLVGGVFTDPGRPYAIAPNAYNHPLSAAGYTNRAEFPTGAYGNQDPNVLWRRLEGVNARRAAIVAAQQRQSQRDKQLEANRKLDNERTGTYVGAGIGAAAGFLIGSPVIGAGFGGAVGKILGGLF